MEIDYDKIDEASLAILSLTLHGDDRVWKGLDWDILNRLHEKGYISDPMGKRKSVYLSSSGLKKAEEVMERMFSVE